MNKVAIVLLILSATCFVGTFSFDGFKSLDAWIKKNVNSDDPDAQLDAAIEKLQGYGKGLAVVDFKYPGARKYMLLLEKLKSIKDKCTDIAVFTLVKINERLDDNRTYKRVGPILEKHAPRVAKLCHSHLMEIYENLVYSPYYKFKTSGEMPALEKLESIVRKDDYTNTDWHRLILGEPGKEEEGIVKELFSRLKGSDNDASFHAILAEPCRYNIGFMGNNFMNELQAFLELEKKPAYEFFFSPERPKHFLDFVYRYAICSYVFEFPQ